MLLQKYLLSDAMTRLCRQANAFRRQVDAPSDKFAKELMEANVQNALNTLEAALCEEKEYTDQQKNPRASRVVRHIDYLNDIRAARTIEEYADTLEKLSKTILGDDAITDIARDADLDAYEWNLGTNFKTYAQRFNDDFVVRNFLRGLAANSIERKPKVFIPENNISYGIVQEYCGEDRYGGHKEVLEKIPLEIYSLCEYKSYDVKQISIRTISGSLLDRNTTITKNSFDAVVCMPPIGLQKKGFHVYENIEYDMFVRATECLREGGWMLLGLPASRFRKVFANFISKNYDNESIIKYLPENYELMGHTVFLIMKKKAAAKEIDAEIFAKITRIPHDILTLGYSNFTSGENLPQIFEVSREEVLLKSFHGSVMDETDMIEMYAESPATVAFRNSQVSKKEQIHASHPLLPFNVGQIGLVLTSGCMDGIIDEGDGCAHAIKGRVIRTSYEGNVDIKPGTNEEVSSTIEASMVEINAFLPDGSYKVLV